MAHVTVIAEFGSSPAPSWNFDAWCWAALRAGVNGVKIQLFRSWEFPESERASKRPLEFPRERLQEYVDAVHAHGQSAGASVFDAEAVELVAKHCDFVKLAAREQDNSELLRTVLRRVSDKPMYRSISRFIPDVAMGWSNMTTLVTIQKYPPSMGASLLTVMRAAVFFRRFARWAPRWGWSSHTAAPGILDCWLAVALGAQVIEKHMAIAPDDLEARHSLSPGEFRRMVKTIRAISSKKGK